MILSRVASGTCGATVAKMTFKAFSNTDTRGVSVEPANAIPGIKQAASSQTARAITIHSKNPKA
jgi:hypothetical protein